MKKWLLLLFLLTVLSDEGLADHAAPQTVPCLPQLTWPPHIAYGQIPAGVSTRATYWIGYSCNLPTGYRTQVWIGKNLDSALLNQFASGLLSQAAAQTQCASRCWTSLTDSEFTFVTNQANAIKPHAVVSFNAGKLTRSTYRANSDGTLNPAAVGTVQVGAVCEESLRIANTSYYAVRITNGAYEYAVCVVSLPYGSN